VLFVTIVHILQQPYKIEKHCPKVSVLARTLSSSVSQPTGRDPLTGSGRFETGRGSG